MKAPCTSGTCRSDQRLKLPSSSLVTARTSTTSPDATPDRPRPCAFGPSSPSACRLRAQVTSSAGMKWPSLILLDAFDADAGARCRPPPAPRPGYQPAMSRGTSTSASAARQSASDPSCVGGDDLAGAAPDALAAVILLQPRRAAPRAATSCRSGSTVARIVRPPAEEFLLAEGAGKLAADFVGEIVARRQRLAERREIAVLHRSAAACPFRA